MTDSQGRAWAWSASLIVGGIVLLLYNLGWLDAYAPWPQFSLATACGVAAAVFFVAFARNRQEWWRLLPAWTLTALATMAMTSTLPDVDRAFVAAQVFAGLALAFGHIYLPARAERWWAILPGGFMLVLAAVVGATSWVTATELLAALLFVGLGLVFFALYWLDQKRRQWWALIPGSVLLVFGAIAFSTGRVAEAGEVANLVRWWPLALILAGLLVLLRSRRASPPSDKLVINSAPRLSSGSGAKNGTGRRGAQPQQRAQPAPRASLGEYSQPAPGATVEILPDDE
jgi:hypothetical protein